MDGAREEKKVPVDNEVMYETATPMNVDDILVVVGEYGRFQKLVNGLFCIMTFPAVYHVMISYFVMDNPSWRCTPGSTKCLKNGTFAKTDNSRCNYNRSDWEYTKYKGYSIVTEFDLSCESSWLIEITTSVLFIGWVFGSVVLGSVSDNYGRKIPLFVSMAVLLFVGFISAFMPNIYAFIICRFIIGFFLPGSFPQMFLYISENVGGRFRAFAGLIIFLFAGITLSILGLKAYLIPHWKYLYIACTAPYVFVLLFYKFVPESVRYLRVKGELDEALDVFKLIARWNRVDFPSNLTIEPPPAIIKHHRSTPLDLFRTPSIAFKTVIQGIAYFIGAMTFFGVYLAASDISGHMYRDYICVTIIEIPISLVMMDFTERFGRKKTVMTTMLIGSVMCVALGFTPKNIEVARVIFGMIGKVSISANCNSIQTWSVELYPTNIRGQGMGFTQVMSRLGAASASFVDKELSSIHEGASFIFMGISSLCAYFLLCFLPEMKGVPTSDSEEEKPGKDFDEIKVMEMTETAFVNPLAELDLDE